jgi:hypothetical protein
MTPDELREYACTLIFEHARDIEPLSIREIAEEHAPDGRISEADANAVADLIAKSSLEVSFPQYTAPDYQVEARAATAAVLRELAAKPDGYLRWEEDGGILYARNLRKLAAELGGATDA